MSRKKKHRPGSTLRIGFLFASFVVGLLCISLLLRFLGIVAKSRFDGANRFTVAFQSKKEVVVASFAPLRNDIVLLRVRGHDPSKRSIGQILAIPIDGIVRTESSLPSDAVRLLWETILSYRGVVSDVTIIDFTRLLLYARSVPLGNVTEKEVDMSLSDLAVDKIVAPLFSFTSLVSEGQSIAIINGSEISGFGQRLGRLITNMGGNVVSVTTAKQTVLVSKVACKTKNSYTCTRLQTMLGFSQSSGSSEPIADITITIGQDSERRQLPF